MFVYDKHLYIYGGWNTLQGFFNGIKYSFEKNDWDSNNMGDGNENFPVWNHCGIEVEAGPGWKYFYFGGSCRVFDETKQRDKPDCVNKICVCDMENEKLTEVQLQDKLLLPEPREDASMVYYQNSKNLLVYGGWNNEWFGDLYGICVSAIVGPSYSVKALEPNMGRISGNQQVTVKGSKLSNGSITVFFILGGKCTSVPGTWVSESEITLQTPSFVEIGPKDVKVRIKIDNEELSTNPINY